MERNTLKVFRRTVGFRGPVDTKQYAPSPPFTLFSHSLVSSWSLGAEAAVVIECGGDAPSLISSLFQTRTQFDCRHIYPPAQVLISVH